MRLLVILAAVNGLFAVAAGAFGAHALRSRLSERRIEVLETGARYQLPHAAVALVAALLSSRSAAARSAAWAFVAGGVLFGGSLYALALTDVRWLGFITPIGGAALLLGWLLLAVAGARLREPAPGSA